MSLLSTIGVSKRQQSATIHHRSLGLLLQVSTLFILSVAGLCAYASLSYSQVVNAAAAAPSHTSKPPVDVTPKAASAKQKTAAAPVASPVTTAAVSAPAPVCLPDTSYQPPIKLNLSQTGLQQVIDPPSSYIVYGNTASQVMSQVARCTPVHSTSGLPGTFVASTAYVINWQANYTSGSSGLCTLNDVRVGLHINQVFPVWQPGSSAEAGLSGRWQSYISKLHAYENGHVQLDQTAAATVLNDLQSFPPTNCGTITQAAANKVNADTNVYDIANANYDSSNNFGIKQGIIL